jgi:negative regulator of replication initiation
MTALKTIRIDQEVYDALASQAKGFETPNAVIRRLLGLAAEEKK